MSRILPPGIPVEKIEGIYKQAIYQLSDSLISHLHEFIQTELEPSVGSAQIQVFPDEYCEGASSIWIYYGGKQDRRIEDDDPVSVQESHLSFIRTFQVYPRST